MLKIQTNSYVSPVNFGEFKRNILVWMKKERENVQEVTGKQALFVVNLESKKIMGEVSEGMVFDIGYSNKITPFLRFRKNRSEWSMCGVIVFSDIMIT